MLPKHVLAVDPGVATGITLLHQESEDVSIVWSDETDWMDTANLINTTIRDYRDQNLVVVCESFFITTQTGKKTQQPASLELIGVTKYLCAAYGIAPPVMQSPQRAKNFVPNDRLKALGLWHRGGAGHAKDALRHGVLYFVEQGWRPENLLVK